MARHLVLEAVMSGDAAAAGQKMRDRIADFAELKESVGETETHSDMRVRDHPILGPVSEGNLVHFVFDGRPIQAIEGEPILAALAAYGIRQCRTTTHRGEPRWFYCGIGRCTDCVMIVNGIPNVRTCVTPVADGMVVETQVGTGHWGEHDALP